MASFSWVETAQGSIDLRISVLVFSGRVGQSLTATILAERAQFFVFHTYMRSLLDAHARLDDPLDVRAPAALVRLEHDVRLKSGRSVYYVVFIGDLVGVTDNEDVSIVSVRGCDSGYRLRTGSLRQGYTVWRFWMGLLGEQHTLHPSLPMADIMVRAKRWLPVSRSGPRGNIFALSDDESNGVQDPSGTDDDSSNSEADASQDVSSFGDGTEVPTSDQKGVLSVEGEESGSAPVDEDSDVDDTISVSSEEADF
ncbi:hypothetical protein PENSPDRAFT_680224 [Peniophora sp. CONT]|nr:hypothetical protein PENSPDRAFT_680224 [Peniophora sp. CONT]